MSKHDFGFAQIFLGLVICIASTFACGSRQVGDSDSLKFIVGGNRLVDCNIEDGHQFLYTDCTGGSACTGQWRHQTAPGFGQLIHLYELRNHCEVQNTACDPHQSFEKTGSEQEGTCKKPLPL